jgi:enoyl-CoA hydratase
MPELELHISTEGGALRMTFDRPASLNSLTADLLDAATAELDKAAADDAIRVVVLTGTGRAFSSGAQLGAARAERPTDATVQAANRLVTAITTVPKPVLAAVNGAAAGVVARSLGPAIS